VINRVQVNSEVGSPGSRAAGLHGVYNAFRYSLAGLLVCWRNEAAFRQEAVIALLMVPAGLWLGTTAVERVLLIGALFLVVIVELLNTAIEAVVDRIGTELHRLSGVAKDLGSAAVFISLLAVGFTWGLIAWDRFF